VHSKPSSQSASTRQLAGRQTPRVIVVRVAFCFAVVHVQSSFAAQSASYWQAGWQKCAILSSE
jgi:hypothetical protein